MLENFRTQKIIWDRANKKIFETIEANSGDSNGRKLVVQIINQEVTESLSGTTLSLGWKSREGAKGLDAFNAVDASKGIFEIYYTTEMLSNIGNIEASLILIDSTGRIESSTFTITIRPSTVDDESVESENSFTALTEALVKVNDFNAQLSQKVGGGNLATMADLGQDVKEAMTGGSVAVVGENAVTEDNIVNKQVTPPKLSFVEQDQQNLFNPYTAIDDKRLLSDGSITTDTVYFLTDFIPVQNGQTLKVFTQTPTKNVFGYASDGTRLKQLTASAATNASLLIDFDGFIRFSVNKNTKFALQIVDAAIYNGNFTPFNYQMADYVTSTPKLKSVGELELKEKSVKVSHIEMAEKGKNIFDKEARQLGGNLVYTSGAIAANAGYDTSDYIPVVKGVSYDLTKNRQWVLFDKGRTYLQGFNNEAYAPTTIVPEQDGYLRFSMKVADVDTAMVKLSSESDEYEPFGYRMDGLFFNDYQVNKIKELVESAPTSDGGVVVKKTGETFDLQSQLSGQEIQIKTTRNGSANGAFNFISTTIGGVNVHSNTDDITPIRTFTTVGANHGYTSIAIVNGSHDKTKEDLGSQWTDGTETFTLLLVETNKLTFGNSYTTDSDGVTSATRKLPTSNLTHVSGATNTTTVNTSNTITGQLYPTIGNLSVTYELDGEEITEDGNYDGDTLIVKESYKILDYGAIIDFAQNNIGVSYAENTDRIAGIVKLSNAYTFRKGLKCTTSHSLLALKNVTLGRCGFLQSFPMSVSGHTVKRFMPNVKAKSGYDFANGVDLSTYNADLVFSQEDNIVPEIPASYTIDWLYNQSGIKTIGFAMGYIVDKTNSKNSDRIINSPNTWDMRGTTKNYPIAIEGVSLEKDDYLNFQGFRNYVHPEHPVVEVEDNSSTYLYTLLDTGVHTYDLSNNIGDSLTTIQSYGELLLNDTVDAGGVVVKSTKDNASGVFKAN